MKAKLLTLILLAGGPCAVFADSVPPPGPAADAQEKKLRSGTANITVPDLTLPAVTSRLVGVAPFAVYFDAQTTTSPLTEHPFHEILFQWDFGNPAAGTYATGALTGGKLDSKNHAEGPQAAHVFERAGTYMVALTARHGGADFKRDVVTIKVEDPETVWAGKTVCVANGTTPVPGIDGCPAGAMGVDTGDAQRAISSALASGARRILFRRGDTFTIDRTAVINAQGPGLIGAYGTGPKPEFTTSVATPFSFGNKVYGAANDWRLVDISISSPNVHDAAAAKLLGFIDNFLMLRVDARSIPLFKSSGGEAGGVAGQTAKFWDGIFVFDSTSTGLDANNATGQNAIYASGYRVALIGNRIDNLRTGEHGIRTYVQRFVAAHNTIENVPRVGITMRAFDWTGGNGVPSGTYSGAAVVASNRLHNVGATIGGGPTNQSIDGRNRDLIFERNYLESSDASVKLGATRNVTVRNNIDRSGGEYLVSAEGMDPGVGQCLGNIWVYGNTFITNRRHAYAFSAGQNPPECANGTQVAVVRNNLLYAPSSEDDRIFASWLFDQMAVTTCDDCNTRGAELRTDPKLDLLFRPQPGSYAAGRGAQVPVWSDYYGAERTGADIGAVGVR